jgi:hypothetical protein
MFIANCHEGSRPERGNDGEKGIKITIASATPIPARPLAIAREYAAGRALGIVRISAISSLI